MRAIYIKILLLMNISFLSSIIVHGAEYSDEDIVVIQFNIGTYGDYLGLRDPEFKRNINKDNLYNERDLLLKEFFKNLRKKIDPDIIMLQEAYGFDPKTEKRKNGILDLIKKFEKKGYIIIEDLRDQIIRPGDAIILFKDKKFKSLGIVPLQKRTLVHLQMRKDTSKKILAASAHLAGFDITGEDIKAMSGDGRAQLIELLKIMEDDQYSDCLKIVGLDANTPPFGMKYKDINGKEFIIKSDRTSLLNALDYESGYELQLKTGLPAPTAINKSVEEGARLDYIFAKAPSNHSVILKEDEESQKKVAPYQLKADDKTPLITKGKKGAYNIPFSDHLPVVSRISAKRQIHK